VRSRTVPTRVAAAVLAATAATALTTAASPPWAKAEGPPVATASAGDAARAALDPAAREADCATLFGGTVNSRDLVPASQIPEAGTVAQWPAAPSGLLPKVVALRGPTETYNSRYQFATRRGGLYVRRAAGTGGGADGWRTMPLPACLAGRVASISADDDELIALDADRRVFVMDNALKGPDAFNWTRRYGMPCWSGRGRTLPAGTLAWSWSVLSPAEDRTWRDDAGNDHAVGNDKVSHIWALRTGGQRLTFMDPWLANDDSYEMCAPRGGAFKAINLSASGSTIFVIGRHGDLYTRLFDFDLSGSDAAFFAYAYEPQRRGDADAPIQLPSPAWVHQPKVPGTITSAISVAKTGTGAIHRTLRVEGLDARGRTGYWEKDIIKTSSSAWRFHRTGAPLAGRRIAGYEPRRDTSSRDLGAVPGVRFAGTIGGVRIAVDGFSPHCTPSRLTLTASGRTLALTLHSVDALRGEVFGPKLEARPRALYGNVEIPAAARKGLAQQPAAIRRLVQGALKDQRFTTINVTATTHALTLTELGWTLRR
jgi:hypothetical protein